jgi:hypothetical protein
MGRTVLTFDFRDSMAVTAIRWPDLSAKILRDMRDFRALLMALAAKMPK